MTTSDDPSPEAIERAIPVAVALVEEFLAALHEGSPRSMGIRAFCATAIARAIDAAVAEAVTKERAKYEEAIAARDRDAPIWQRIEAIAGGIVDPAVAAAVADERERCAAIVRGEVEETWRAMDDGEQLRRRVLLACARAIEGEAPAARTIREGAKP